MIITISPTQDQSNEEFPHRSVSIESPHDGITLFQAAEMVRSALIAWGYSSELVDELILNQTPE